MGEKNKKGEKEGGGKSSITVVLKTDLHCEGCATKVVKCIKSLDGVETVAVDNSAKITVVGKVDPAKLREKLEHKTHKKVELISPQIKKENKSDNNGGDEKENGGKGKGNDNGKKQEKNREKQDKNVKDNAKSDEKKKPKEPPVTTAVLKVHLHCQGCIQKIHKLVSKTKGYEDMKIDKQKDLVTVTGAMDMKAVAEMLKKHLKREVEIVPPKKEEKKENGGGREKGKGGGGGGGKEKGGNGGGGGKEKGGNGGGGGKEKGGNVGADAGDGGKGSGGGGDSAEGNKMQFQVGYPNPFVYEPGFVADQQFHYNTYPMGPYNAPQMFSDENPNACTVM